MTLETLTTITLLTELLLALRANDPKGFKPLLEMDLQPAYGAQPTYVSRSVHTSFTATAGAAPAAVASV